MAPNEETLTESQKNVLDYIQKHLDEFHRPPTVREIMRHFKWSSPQSARKHLLALEEKGYLEREDHTARGLTLVDDEPAPQGLVVPLLGRVAAGLPILAEENREGSLVVDPSPTSCRGTRSSCNRPPTRTRARWWWRCWRVRPRSRRSAARGTALGSSRPTRSTTIST
jgi:hypothetical protein